MKAAASSCRTRIRRIFSALAASAAATPVSCSPGRPKTVSTPQSTSRSTSSSAANSLTRPPLDGRSAPPERYQASPEMRSYELLGNVCCTMVKDEPVGEVPFGDRPGEQEALGQRHPGAAQQLRLRLALHPLDHRLQVEDPADGDDQPEHRVGSLLLTVREEAAVDLELVDREGAER